MTIGTIDESQRKAATVVGFSYLFALPPAIFAEFYVRTQLIAFDNAAQTARNIMAHERLVDAILPPWNSSQRFP